MARPSTCLLYTSKAASPQRIRVDTQDGALQRPRILDRRVRIVAARRCRVIDGQHHIGLPDDRAVGFQLRARLLIDVYKRQREDPEGTERLADGRGKRLHQRDRRPEGI